MKTRLFLFFTCLLLSCSDINEIPDASTAWGALKQIASTTAEGTQLESRYFYYSDTGALERLVVVSPDYVEIEYHVTYENNIPTSLKRRIDYVQETGIDREEEYRIENVNNQIIFSPTSIGNTVEVTKVNGYVSVARRYYGDIEEYVTEEQFEYDANMNLERILVYDTNQSDTNFLVWTYEFSEFETPVGLRTNQVPITESSLFDFYQVLQLQVSNQVPTRVSKRSGNGVFENPYRLFQFNPVAAGNVVSATATQYENTFPYTFSYYGN